VTQPPRPLADRLADGDRLQLLFVKLPAPAEVELAGLTGFDAVILDTEHGTEEGLDHHLRAADAVGLPALVRVPGTDPAPILRALDAGATGVVVAHVCDAAQAEAAVAAAHYPPRGTRGLALTTRAGRHGTANLSEHLRRAAQQTLVIAQIEDAEAVEQTAAICAVDGVGAVLIGATDLSISLGHPGATGHPAVAGAIAEITKRARANNVPVATVVSSRLEAESASTQIVVSVASLLVRDAFRAAAAPLGGAGSGPAQGEPVVLLPGMLETAELWDAVAPAIGEVAAVRLGRIEFDASVEEMAESILVATPGRFAVAGHSLGAIVALELVRRAPERITRLALLNSSALAPTDTQLADWEALATQATEGSFADLVRSFALSNAPTHRHDDAELLVLVERMASSCGPRVLLRQLAAQRSRTDVRPALASITVPTLVISGGEDVVCPPARQDELAAAIPGARLERLEAVGHLAPLEAPERVAQLLADWFTPPPPVSR
jgi:4-hydroxy-2-oxoheptanedioate aldolase